MNQGNRMDDFHKNRFVRFCSKIYVNFCNKKNGFFRLSYIDNIIFLFIRGVAPSLRSNPRAVFKSFTKFVFYIFSRFSTFFPVFFYCFSRISTFIYTCVEKQDIM